MAKMLLEVQLAYPDAQAPSRAHEGDAGYDLYAYEGAAIPPHESALIETGVCIAVPKGTYGRIAPRSGLSTKGVMVNAGVVDQGYRGVVKVLLHNMRGEPYEVKKGDRIAQVILELIATPPLRVVERLDDTSRGASGFGSSGR